MISGWYTAILYNQNLEVARKVKKIIKNSSAAFVAGSSIKYMKSIVLVSICL